MFAHLGGAGHRGQRLDVDNHGIGAVLRGGPAGGNHHRDRIAGEAHLGVGHGEMGGHDQGPGHPQSHGGAAIGKILGGENRHNTLGGPGIASLDFDQPPMGHRAPHEHRLQEARLVDVVHKSPGAGQKARVLPTGDAGAGEPHGR